MAGNRETNRSERRLARVERPPPSNNESCCFKYHAHRVSVTDSESRGMSTKVDPVALASALLTHQREDRERERDAGIARD